MASLIIVGSGVLGTAYAAWQARSVLRAKGQDADHAAIARTEEEAEHLNPTSALEEKDDPEDAPPSGGGIAEVMRVAGFIAEGARSFLFYEYIAIGAFMLVFAPLIGILIGSATGESWQGIGSAVAFLAGAATSMISGYLGMIIAVAANWRTTLAAREGHHRKPFLLAYKGGSVMGFGLTGFGLLLLYICLLSVANSFSNIETDAPRIMEIVAGFGLGASSVALFGRVGGGIYTKAADIGADTVGKVDHDIPEDSIKNPGTIADNVGDNVGDVAGMGADLFGSFAEATCAALVIAASSPQLSASWAYLMYPVILTAGGLLGCLLVSILAPRMLTISQASHVERALRWLLLLSTAAVAIVDYVFSLIFLPDKFSLAPATDVEEGDVFSTRTNAFVCVLVGSIGGLAIGLVTELYTSKSYKPVKRLVEAAKLSAASNVISGLALGYISTVIPVFIVAVCVMVSLPLAGFFGVSLAALGMLSTLAIALTIDAYGPITDNAGGIAEMAGLSSHVRAITDDLDAAGNTTAAIGKGFAIGSASLVSLALFGAFVTRANLNMSGVNVLEPVTFGGLLIGAMLPYWFSAMAISAVAKAADAVVSNIHSQFVANPRLKDLTSPDLPDFKACVGICTRASLLGMIGPGMLVIFSPIIAGLVFGEKAVAGLLAGTLVSSVQMAVSASNSGGAWDNAKKAIEAMNLPAEEKKHMKKNAVVGDTVGDPLKDTSGPSLNILMKLTAIVSLVLVDVFTRFSARILG